MTSRSLRHSTWGVLLLGAWLIAGCFHGGPDGASDDGEGVSDLTLRLEEVVSGLDRPTFATHAGDGSGALYVLEQPGVVRLFDGEELHEEPVLDIRDEVGTDHFEMGLLGMAFPPHFPEDDRVFLSFTDTSRVSVVSSFRVAQENPLRLDPESGDRLLELKQPYGNHNGGMVAFGPDGMLYAGFGDGGSAGDPLENGQDPSVWLGSLLRIDVSSPGGYEVPGDNPFVGTEEGAPEVWAYGLRNPWRFSFDRGTGDLWLADVGQDAWEEVNHVPAGEGAGANFGWSFFEGNERFAGGSSGDVEDEDLVFPVAVVGLQGAPHCSVTGGYVYRGDAVPALDGVYLFSDWCSGVLWGLEKGGEEEDGETAGEWRMEELLETGRRVSSFAEDEAGEVYVVDHEGAVLRVEAG